MKIYLDYDSTLVNFVDVWIDLINEKTEDQISLDEITLFHHPILSKHDWLFLKYPIYDHVIPFDGAIDFVQTLQKHHDVTILTHITDPDGGLVKIPHIRKYFGDVPIICTGDHKHLFTGDGLLIDDGIHNIQGHVSTHNTPAILFNHLNRYNYIPREVKSPIIYTTSYEEILTHI